MKKIDRLGWAAGITFVSYGLRIGIRVSNPEIMDRIEGVLPPHAKPARGPRVGCLYSLVVSGTKVGSNIRRFNILYADAVRLARTKNTDQVLEALETDLQLYVAERARRRVFVHAGVVGWRGRAIVIPGRTMSGKTTLVRALVRAGATYYSDEYAVLDERGRVHPYLKPMSMRENGDGRPMKILPEALGGDKRCQTAPSGFGRRDQLPTRRSLATPPTLAGTSRHGASGPYGLGQEEAGTGSHHVATGRRGRPGAKGGAW